MSRNTVIKAEREVASGIEPPNACVLWAVVTVLSSTSSPDWSRRGRDRASRHPRQSDVAAALDLQVDAPPRRCPCRKGFKVSDDTVGRILKSLGYSLQAPPRRRRAPRILTGRPVLLPERAGDAFVHDDQPVISVDTRRSCDTRSHVASGLADRRPAYAGA